MLTDPVDSLGDSSPSSPPPSPLRRLKLVEALPQTASFRGALPGASVVIFLPPLLPLAPFPCLLDFVEALPQEDWLCRPQQW